MSDETKDKPSIEDPIGDTDKAPAPPKPSDPPATPPPTPAPSRTSRNAKAREYNPPNTVQVHLLNQHREFVDAIHIEAPAPYRFAHNKLNYERVGEDPTSGCSQYAPMA